MVVVGRCDHDDRAGRRWAIHDRSLLVLPDAMVGEWLDPSITDPARVQEMVDAVPPPTLVPYPVGKAVNNVRNNGPELVEPLHL